MSKNINSLFGFSSIDITPEIGVELDGYHREGPSTGIKDKLTASSIVISHANENYALISIDSIGMTVPFATSIRKKVAKFLNTTLNHVMLCYTHTHSSPKTLDEKNELNEYSEFLSNQVVFSIKKSVENLSECKVGWGVVDSSIGVNRREKTNSGSVVMGTDLNGHVDNRIGILKIVDSDTSELKTIILRVSAHGNSLKGDNLEISSDYFNQTRKMIMDKYNCNVLMINGAAGNINAKYRGSEDDLVKMAKEILKSVDSIIGEIVTDSINKISMDSIKIDTYTQEIPSLDTAVELSKAASNAWEVDTSEWLSDIRNRIENKEKRISVIFELQKFEINKGMFLGCPMEIFSETASELTALLKNELIFLNGYTNGYYMYLPSKDEMKYGGYEVDWCPVVYGPRFGILMPFSTETERSLIKNSILLANETTSKA